MGTSKQERKYKSKLTEDLPEPIEKKETFRVLIDNANFLHKKYHTFAEADQAGREFCQGNAAVYEVVGGCN